MPDHLDATFTALADPTRRAILARLTAGEATVTELAEPFEISQPAISKHLKVLEPAGSALRVAGAGDEAGPLRDALAWLEDYRRYWEESYQRLDALLDELSAAERAPDAQPGNR